MITYLQGTLLLDEDDQSIGVLANGVGYQVTVSDRDRTLCGARGRGGDIALFTRLFCRGDGEPDTLFGFMDLNDRVVFDRMLRIPKMGPATAMKVISALNREQLAETILAQNKKALVGIKGVGAKTAEALIECLRL